MDPVSILEQRVEFLEGVIATATLCNWSPADRQDLRAYLLEEIIRIDNTMFDVYDETHDKDLALAAWEALMEGLRHWLSLSLGVKIKFI
jgi:hypothetical protein